MAKKAFRYSGKLKDPRWQKLRLLKLQQADWACENCGTKENTLHVHHGYYEWGKDPWDYESSSLQVLCEVCHGEAEWYKDWFKKFLTTQPLAFQASIFTVLQLTGTYSESTELEVAECLSDLLIAAATGDPSRARDEFERLLTLAQSDGLGNIQAPE